jgi:hypothetical protein
MIKSDTVARQALRGRRHDTVGSSFWYGNAAPASPPAIGYCAVTCRRGYMYMQSRSVVLYGSELEIERSMVGAGKVGQS